VAAIFVAGEQHRGGEGRVVRSVGEILTLYGHAVVVVVASSGFVGRATGEPVTGVNLHAGLVGRHCETAACIVVGEDGNNLNFAGSVIIHGPAIVVSLAVDKSREFQFYLCSKRFGLGEVHGRTSHRHKHAFGNEGAVGGQIVGCPECEFFAQNGAGVVTG